MKRRAWITGDVLQGGGEVCRRFILPDDPTIRAAFLGALVPLTEVWNWEQGGSMTPREASEIMTRVVNSVTDDCALSDAPFWDDTDGGDADGDEELLFAWYEDLADWIVQAFLATSFTPAAAITFVTTARKIRLAFRTANWGALADIFIDNVLVDTVDTYSPELGVIENAYDLDVIQPAFTAQASETATLRIVHRGEANDAAVPTGDGYGVSVIRKRLQSSIFTPSSTAPTVKRIYRVLRSGKMQYSDDGGETWDDADTLPEYPPLPPRSETTEEERRCLAARNAAEIIRLATIEIITAWNTTSDPLQTISDLVGFITGAVALFLGNPILALVATGFELFQNALAVIEAGLDTAWNTETTDKLTCLLFELASDDGNGKVTFDFEGVRYRGNEVYSDARLIVIHQWLLGIIGSTGLDLAGATTSVSSWDCSGCVEQWCYAWSGTEWDEWDVVTDVAWLRYQGGDNRINAATTVTDANGWLGSGYNQQYRPVAIQLSFPSPTFVSVVTATGSGVCYFSDSRDNYGSVRKQGFGDFNINDYVEGVRVFVYAASNPRLNSVVAQGEGSEPFGQSTCEE
jgi:hypothetical protein